MNGHFGIANHNPMYFLSPIQNIASSRIELVNNETWQNIEDYHEHLEISLQSSESHKVTDLLINTIYNFHEDPKRILELGCGSGRNLKKLALAFPNSEVIGVDINNAAKSTLFPGNVRFINCNVLEFDFSQFEKFDLILTSGFLMHINHLLLPNLMTKIMQNSKRQIFWELHGNSNSWDFHRYPRNYAEFLINNGYSFDRYTVYCQHPIFSKGLTSNFAHSLLVRAE
jgi:SAM-dependent methyltransferase